MVDKRLIDANALVDKVRLDWGLTHQCQLISATTKLAAADAMCKLLGEVAKSQTIDAVEVVHGRWEDATEVIAGIRHPQTKCSACEKVYWGHRTECNYCPNCGAKMDGGAT